MSPEEVKMNSLSILIKTHLAIEPSLNDIDKKKSEL